MSEVKFPNLIAATAVVFTTAMLYAGGGGHTLDTDGGSSWKINTPPLYEVKQLKGTHSFVTIDSSNVEESFEQEIQDIFISLCDGQEALGKEYEAAWNANIDSLYES
ncbi:hypothetical protein [Acetobacter pasteurianus]|uniref:Uncharacterized protein n=1 Tax=Acetobacter pasteurianus NBRC 3188 TaxID=1226663 RepID=A0A401WUZ7_ACEPA|nr:hypothetical protein [Acetobacter pasteurianus]GCD53080.1 hypothetical protein NBRC3188_1777 [Acetobacter pasteurianus NBRC 3188]